MRNSVGLYIGENVVSAAIVTDKGRGGVRVSSVNMSALEGREKEVLNRNVILETMVNKCLREIEGENSRIFVSLADKDFIFRSIDFPLMGKQEIESSIMFEIEKYVPFKIRDLIWDYSFVRFPKEKKIKVSFLGIRKKIYQEYMNIFREINVEVNNIEPSSISLARLMKSIRSTRKIESFILLDFSESESYITFFYKDLPIFNRYLNIVASGGNVDMEKLNEEVRISIQYFRREFRTYELTRLFVICRKEEKHYFNTLGKYVESEVTILTSEEIMNREGVSVECVKSYGVASTPFIYYGFHPFLQEGGGKSRAKEEIFSSIPLNIPLLSAITGIGMLACLFLYIFFSNNISVKRYEVKKIEEKISIPNKIKKMSISEIKKYFSQRKQEKADLEKKFLGIESVSPLLEDLPEILGKGMWLTEFSLIREKENKISITMEGYIFRDNPEEERDVLDDFVAELKESPNFKEVFDNVNLIIATKDTFEGLEVLRFVLKLK